MKRWIITYQGWRQVEGFKVKNDYGIDLFCHKKYYGAIEWERGDPWKVSEGKTGLAIAEFETKSECTIQSIEVFLAQSGKTPLDIQAAINRNHEKIVEKFGVKPQEATK